MLTKDDLKQIGQAMEAKLEAEQRQTEKFVHEEIQASEERIKKDIRDAHEDIIDTLTDLIHTGYSLHEKRIKRVEERLDLPPLH